MNIAGYMPNSFVDYPGGIAGVVFFGGCNFDCWYCHNKQLIGATAAYSANDILQKLDKRKHMLDAVVLTGGEPTLQDVSELLDFVYRIKAMQLKVKLDTNGTKPEVLRRLLPHIDYVAMDIKAPFTKYSQFTKVHSLQLLAMQESIKLLLDSEVDCEFRTTFAPSLTQEDILEIAETVKGCKKYYLQQYVAQENKEIAAYPSSYLKGAQAMLRKKGYPCEIRGI